MIFANRDNQRELDDQALEILCGFLDNNSHPGVRYSFTKETWSGILRRRIKDRYPRSRETSTVWITRHFQLRQVTAKRETALQSAAHVAKIWSNAGHRIQPRTVLGVAQRKAARDAALKWIDETEKQEQRALRAHGTFYNAATVYSATERAIERIAEELQPVKKVNTTAAR